MVTTTVGFIRVRKRKLKVKYRWIENRKGEWRKVRRDKSAPTESVSYDLVRAVRIDGKPRHKFVLGFGSPVSASKYEGERRGVTLFWRRSFDRMEKHGFSKDQRFEIAEKLRRKGISLPTLKECKAQKVKHIAWKKENLGLGTPMEPYDEVIGFVRHSNRSRVRRRPT